MDDDKRPESGTGPPHAGASRPRLARDRLALLLGTGLGAGFARWAPGTAGTLVPGLPIALGLGALGIWATLGGAILLFAVGVWASGACERILGRRDPPEVVIDEALGYVAAVAGLGLGWEALAAGFVLFRVFDILKPWPVRLVDQRVPGGLGIMLDDLVAALYARAAIECGLWALSRLA